MKQQTAAAGSAGPGSSPADSPDLGYPKLKLRRDSAARGGGAAAACGDVGTSEGPKVSWGKASGVCRPTEPLFMQRGSGRVSADALHSPTESGGKMAVSCTPGYLVARYGGQESE